MRHYVRVLAYLPGIALLACAGLALLVLWTLNSRRDVLLAGVGFTAALDLQLGGIHATTLLSVLLLIVARRTLAEGADVRPPTAWPLLGVLLAATLLIAATSVFGALVNSPRLGLQLVALAGTAVILAAQCTHVDVPFLLRGLLAGATLGSGIAVLQNLGIAPADYFIDSSGIPRVRSIYREPDFLAVYASIGFILSLRIIARRKLQVGLLVVHGTALTLTFARAAVLALIVGALAATLASRLRRQVDVRRRNTLLLMGVLLAACVAVAASPTLRANTHLRLAGAIDSSTDYSVQARQRQGEVLLRLSDEAPWYGYGLSSAGRVKDLGEVQFERSENNVASNWMLGLWVDAKMLALPFMLLIIAISLVTVHQVGGHLLTFLLVNSLFTNMLFFPVTWLCIALALTHLRVDRPPLSRATQGAVAVAW